MLGTLRLYVPQGVGMATCLISSSMLLSPVLPCQIWSFYVKAFERNHGDLPENFDPLPLKFLESQSRRPCNFRTTGLSQVTRGHSRSLETTRIDRPPMTSYQCSMVTVGLSRVVFEIKGNICKKKHFPPLHLTPPRTGFPLECYSGDRAQINKNDAIT